MPTTHVRDAAPMHVECDGVIIWLSCHFATSSCMCISLPNHAADGGEYCASMLRESTDANLCPQQKMAQGGLKS